MRRTFGLTALALCLVFNVSLFADEESPDVLDETLKGVRQFLAQIGEGAKKAHDLNVETKNADAAAKNAEAELLKQKNAPTIQAIRDNVRQSVKLEDDLKDFVGLRMDNSLGKLFDKKYPFDLSVTVEQNHDGVKNSPLVKWKSTLPLPWAAAFGRTAHISDSGEYQKRFGYNSDAESPTRRRKRVNTLKMVLDYGKELDAPYTPEERADINQRARTTWNGRIFYPPVLLASALNGSFLDGAKTIIESDQFDTNEANRSLELSEAQKESPAFYYPDNHGMKGVKWLMLAAGLDGTVLRKNRGKDMLGANRAEIVKAMLKKGAKVDAKVDDEIKFTPIGLKKQDTMPLRVKGMTAIVAAAWTCNTHAIEPLVSAGADLNQKVEASTSFKSDSELQAYRLIELAEKRMRLASEAKGRAETREEQNRMAYLASNCENTIKKIRDMQEAKVSQQIQAVHAATKDSVSQSSTSQAGQTSLPKESEVHSTPPKKFKGGIR